MTETKFLIREERQFPDHFTMLPNMIDDLDLSLIAFRLYVHLKRVVGETGICWQSTSTMAKACKMSGGSISAAKGELETNGLIYVSKVGGAGGLHDEIVLADIWDKNREFYKMRSAGERQRSAGERINTPTNNTPIQRVQNEILQLSTVEEGSPLAEEITQWQTDSAEDLITFDDDLNKPLKKDDYTQPKKPRTSEEYKAELAAAMQRGIDAQTGAPDHSDDYPADITDIISEFSYLFGIPAPRRKERSYTLWISAARELLSIVNGDANVLVEYYENKYRKDKDPFSVYTPKSIVNAVRAFMGERESIKAKPKSIIESDGGFYA
jgi:hypothetical protein